MGAWLLVVGSVGGVGIAVPLVVPDAFALRDASLPPAVVPPSTRTPVWGTSPEPVVSALVVEAGTEGERDETGRLAGVVLVAPAVAEYEVAPVELDAAASGGPGTGPAWAGGAAALGRAESLTPVAVVPAVGVVGEVPSPVVVVPVLGATGEATIGPVYPGPAGVASADGAPAL